MRPSGIPPDTAAPSTLHAWGEDAVRLGADGVGDTLHVGTPAQEEDFAQFRAVREQARRFGMPLIVWACPRGSGVRWGKAGEEARLEKARQSMEAGATGLIFGRNIWQRDHDDSLRLVAALRETLAKYPG